MRRAARWGGAGARKKGWQCPWRMVSCRGPHGRAAPAEGGAEGGPHERRELEGVPTRSPLALFTLRLGERAPVLLPPRPARAPARLPRPPPPRAAPRVDHMADSPLAPTRPPRAAAPGSVTPSKRKRRDGAPGAAGDIGPSGPPQAAALTAGPGAAHPPARPASLAAAMLLPVRTAASVLVNKVRRWKAGPVWG